MIFSYGHFKTLWQLNVRSFTYTFNIQTLWVGRCNDGYRQEQLHECKMELYRVQI